MNTHDISDLTSSFDNERDLDHDGLVNPVAGEDTSDEEVAVFEILDEKNNVKKENKRKKYKLKPVPARIGLKLNAH